MKKILVITGDANTLIYHRGEILKDFARSGLEVVAAAAEDYDYVKEYLHEIGGRYEQVDLTRSGLNPWQDLKSLRSIHRLIQRERPDYIFTYAIKAVIYGSIAARWRRVPHVYCLVPGLGYAFSPDGSWKQRLVSTASSLMYAAAFRCVDKVFLQNWDDEELLRGRRILPRHLPTHVTLGSGVKLDQFEFRDLERDAEWKAGRLRFILVSRLLKKKGIAEFAEVARRLKARDPRLGFDLVGPLDPSPDGVPAEQVKAWHEEGLVTYHGFTRNVPKFLRQAHVFVLPTYYREGVPRSALEALSSGLPVVTTEGPGSRETVRLTPEGQRQRAAGESLWEGENGYLIPQRDVDALEEALWNLACNREQLPAMGRASRRLAEERFDVRAVNDGILRHMGLSLSAEPEPRAKSAAAA